MQTGLSRMGSVPDDSGIYDLGWKPSEHLTCNQADLGRGYAWRTSVYLKQNLRARFGQ